MDLFICHSVILFGTFNYVVHYSICDNETYLYKYNADTNRLEVKIQKIT